MAGCEKCVGGHRRSKDNPLLWEDCECLTEALFEAYLTKIMPKERWEKYGYLKESILHKSTRAEKIIHLPKEDIKFDTFYTHLKTSLRYIFFGRRLGENKKPPLTCNIVSPAAITETRYDRFTGQKQKKAELFDPDLLILAASSWQHFEASFSEIELLVCDRTQNGKGTWLVSNDFEKLKNAEYRVTTSFRQLLDRLNINKIVLARSDLSSSNMKAAPKESKKPVLNIKRGLGVTGLDDSLWIPQDTKFSNLDKELT